MKPENKRTCYIAGPMTGYPLFNFPAFAEAAASLRDLGWLVISPAELDLDAGFDPARDTVDKEFLDAAMKRDCDAILSVDAMFMLPGWRASTGATAEMWMARWRHLPVYEYPTLTLLEQGDCSGTGKDPKKPVGDTKCPLHLLPPVALEQTAWAQAEGARDYGPYNWRQTGICFETYHAAIMRHLLAIAKGDWFDTKSNLPHVAHIAANVNILMDADHHGKLTR